MVIKARAEILGDLVSEKSSLQLVGRSGQLETLSSLTMSRPPSPCGKEGLTKAKTSRREAISSWRESFS